MPIIYETPAPVAAAASIYDRAFSGGGGGFGGGGRGGGGPTLIGGSQTPYDTGIQGAILARDQMYQDRGQEAEQLAVRAAMFGAEQQNQFALQQQRFSLQAQLQEMELTQQEKMRLSRMKNAIGEVSADPHYSDDEKADIITQLRTGINPLENRLARTKIEQEKQVKDAIVEQRRMNAALNEERLKVAATKFEDKQKYVVPFDVLTEITEDIKTQLGPAGIAMLGPAGEKIVEAMARSEATRQKLGSMYLQQPDGSWEPMDGMGNASAGAGKGRTGASSGEPRHSTGLTASEYLKAREHVEAAVARKAAETTTDDLGNKKPKYPELADAGKYQEEVAARLKGAGLPVDFNEFNQGAKVPESAGPRKYQSKFKPGVAAAATGGTGGTPPSSAPAPTAQTGPAPKPFKADLSDADRGQVQAFHQMDSDLSLIAASQLPEDQKLAAAFNIKALKDLLAKHGSVEAIKRNEADWRQFQMADRAMSEFMGRVRPNQPARKAPMPGAALPTREPSPAQRLFGETSGVASFIDRQVGNPGNR